MEIYLSVADAGNNECLEATDCLVSRSRRCLLLLLLRWVTS